MHLYEVLMHLHVTKSAKFACPVFALLQRMTVPFAPELDPVIVSPGLYKPLGVVIHNR